MDRRLHDPAAAWRRVGITGWSGHASRLLDIASGTALWDHPGTRVPIRRVLVRAVAGAFEPQAFLCTDLDADPLDIPRWFVRRWSDQAVERPTPVPPGPYAPTTLWSDELIAAGGPPAPGASWYPKERLAFGDASATVRHRIRTSTTSAPSPDDADVIKVPRTHLDRLVRTVRYPA